MFTLHLNKALKYYKAKHRESKFSDFILCTLKMIFDFEKQKRIKILEGNIYSYSYFSKTILFN